MEEFHQGAGAHLFREYIDHRPSDKADNGRFGLAMGYLGPSTLTGLEALSFLPIKRPGI